MKPWFYLLTLVALAQAANASEFEIGGDFACLTDTQICSATYSFFFNAVVGVDTVYAPDGVTPLYTLTDVALNGALSPSLASQVETDSTQPSGLTSNLGPFTTLSDTDFVVDEYGSPCTGSNPNEFLTQSGTLVTSGVTFNSVSGGITSPSIYTDLTGAVTNATVTSDVVNVADLQGYNLDILFPGQTSVCGIQIPAGYTAEMVQTVAWHTYLESISEVETGVATSPAPEPRFGTLIGIAIAGLALARRGARARLR